MKKITYITMFIAIVTIVLFITIESNRSNEPLFEHLENEAISQTEIGGGIVLDPGQSYTFIDWKKKLNKECVKKEGHTCTIVNDTNKTSAQERWYVKIGIAIIQIIASIL